MFKKKLIAADLKQLITTSQVNAMNLEELTTSQVSARHLAELITSQLITQHL